MMMWGLMSSDVSQVGILGTNCNKLLKLKLNMVGGGGGGGSPEGLEMQF